MKNYDLSMTVCVECKHHIDPIVNLMATGVLKDNNRNQEDRKKALAELADKFKEGYSNIDFICDLCQIHYRS